MKVLTIISKLEMGGIEKTLLSCLPFFYKENIEMTILCSLGGALDSSYRKQGVELIDFGSFKKPILDSYKLYRVLKKGEFDIVHSRYGHNSGFFTLVCKLLNIPILVSIHNQKAMFKSDWADKPILKIIRKKYLDIHKRMTQKYATKVIGHSKANLKYYTSNYENNSDLYSLLYNGVDFSKFRKPIDSNNQDVLDEFLINSNKVFVHIGSFKHQKNHLFLLDLFNNLNPIKNEYKLILLGIGGLFSDVKKKIEELGLESNIYMAGMDSNIEPYLSRSDIFIFPSLYEGFGNVLIEAQYMGVSICASDIAPHYEATFEDYHRYFYDPEKLNDAVKKVSQCIEDIDRGMHKELKQNAVIFSENFSIENMTKKMIFLYKGSKS